LITAVIDKHIVSDKGN